MHATPTTPGHWMVDIQHRQISTSAFVAALVVAFGIGLLTGLVALRTVGQGASTAAHVNAVAAPAAAAPAVARSCLSADGQDIQLGTRCGSATLPVAHVNTIAVPAAAAPAVARSCISADGQDIQRGTRCGSATLPAAAPTTKPVSARSAIMANGQDLKPANLLGWR